jgi:hypothetical protein
MVTYTATGPKVKQAKAGKKMHSEEILSRVQAQAQQCVGWNDSRLSDERLRVNRYYNSTFPKRQHKGSSAYVSSDVYDSVEQMKSQLLETFTANGEDIIKFEPQNENDVEMARVATLATSYAIWRENDAETFMHDAAHDGLTARVGITKVYWDEDYKYEDHIFDNLNEDEVMGLNADEQVDAMDAQETEAGNDNYSGTLTRKYDRSKVSIDPVPPEEFRISKRARSIRKADMVEHVTPKTKDELKDMYPKFARKIDGLNYDAQDILDSSDALERNAHEGDAPTKESVIQPELDKIDFHEAYVKLDLRDGHGACLYKVCYSGAIMFACEEVDRSPFFPFVPLPIPHTFFGNNFAARVIPTQNARTVLTRGILDHTQITVNPRWGVVKGGLTNPREMLENRLGGIVNMNRPDAVKALEYSNLNPFVFQTLEMLKSNKEENTGISALSQGLNKDAVSTQNSQGLVEGLVNLSQGRSKVVARNFAKYLCEIYLEVYRLILENQKHEKIVEVAGNWVPINVQNWIERTDCKVSVHLGPGEKDRAAAKYAATYKELSSDPSIAHYFSGPKKHAMITDGLKLAGFDSPSKYLEPANTPPPPPDPFKTRELDIKDKQATAALTTAQAAAMHKQMDGMLKMMTSKLDDFSTRMDVMFKGRESDRLDLETSNRVDVSQREIELAEKAPPADTNTIVSPNG